MIAIFHQLYFHVSTANLLRQSQGKLPGHILVALPLDQPQRHIKGNFPAQQQVAVALVQQQATDAVGFTVVIAVGQVSITALRPAAAVAPE